MRSLLLEPPSLAKHPLEKVGSSRWIQILNPFVSINLQGTIQQLHWLK